MKSSTRKKYSNRFKARIALKATDAAAINRLSEEHAIPAGEIERWRHQLNDRAELLFIADEKSDHAEAVEHHAALLRTTLEASPNGILVTDLDRNIMTYNQKCAQMWEVPEHLLAKGEMGKIMQHILKLVQNPDAFHRSVKKLYEDIDSSVHDVIELKDGRFFERHSVPYEVDGNMVGRVTNFVDITEYKKSEQKLSRFGNLLQSINANVSEGIFRSTPDDGLLYVNDAFVEIFGYNSQDEALEMAPPQYYADDAIRERLLKSLKEEGQFKNEEALFRRKDGSTFWGLESSTLVENNGEVYIDGVVANIDNWKEAQQALRRSEEKYRTILSNIKEGYFETNLNGDFTFVNAALVDIMHYPADEMIGMNNREYLDEENAKKVFDTFNRVYETGNAEKGFDWEIICGDGTRIYVEASVTLRSDANGEPIGFSGMVRDITERKRKQKQIRNSLKEKEVLLEEIHHRVKNNLAVISGLLYLQADKTKDTTASEALMQSQNRINSMALIHELLYDTHSFASLKPQTYIEQLVQHISANLSPGQADITTKIKAENFDLEMSTAIPCALIINELITNAYKYAFEGRDEGTVEISFKKRADERYHLKVADDGRGLPDDFELNNSGHHSLGLSLVKTLTRQLGGKLETQNGSGAEFVVTFGG